MLHPFDYQQAFYTQSQNSSANMALCVDDYLKNSQEFLSRENIGWNQIQDTVLYTTYDAFLFLDNAYYFPMLVNLINNLIPTGIMNHLIDVFYTKRWKFLKTEKEPKVLNFDDLQFGFKIWFGSCLIAFLTFLLEKGTKFRLRRTQERRRHYKITKSKAGKSNNVVHKQDDAQRIKMRTIVKIRNNKRKIRELKTLKDAKMDVKSDADQNLSRVANDQIKNEMKNDLKPDVLEVVDIEQE
jgi:hypothetical protein